MAREETVDLPTTGAPQPLPQSVHFPALIRPSGTTDGVINTASQSCGNAPGTGQENIAINHSELDDDEVQFVFSVPRRKRKKRKRVGSSHNSSIVRGNSETSASPRNSLPRPTSMSSQRLRRGSTGMVQQLDPCHMSGDLQISMKSGSLPALAQIPEPRLASCQPTSTVSPDMLHHSAHSLSFADVTPWWNIQLPFTQGNGSFQFDICGMPFAEEILKKRKYYEEPEAAGLDPCLGSRLGFPKGPQSELPATNTGRIFAHADQSLGGLNGVSLGSIANSRLQTPVREAHTRKTPGPSLAMEVPHNLILPQKLPAIFRDMSAESQSRRQPFQQLTRQNSSPVRQHHHDWCERQVVQVPVSLVPELSVSPRTKTVQVFRPVNPNQDQSQNTPSQSSAMSRTTTLPRPHGRQLAARANAQSTESMNLNSDGVGPSILSSISPLQTTPRDILRKPSLYKIPPWPSPPISPRQPQCMNHKPAHMRNGKSKKSPVQVQELASPHTLPSAAVDATYTQRTPCDETQANSYNTAKAILTCSSKVQEQVSRPAAVTEEHQAVISSYQQSPNTTTSFVQSPNPVQTSQSTRKHSPNLIVDIAETCQENFPFAAVAERHNQPIQKVFDAFSAVIQLPLLRSAADNRRHGELAKTRMKEFRDAKKAMERAQEQERKKVLREKGKAEIGDLTEQKRSKKAPGLLKAAILNNARCKEGDLES